MWAFSASHRSFLHCQSGICVAWLCLTRSSVLGTSDRTKVEQRSLHVSFAFNCMIFPTGHTRVLRDSFLVIQGSFMENDYHDSKEWLINCDRTMRLYKLSWNFYRINGELDGVSLVRVPNSWRVYLASLQFPHVLASPVRDTHFRCASLIRSFSVALTFCLTLSNPPSQACGPGDGHMGVRIE